MTTRIQNNKDSKEKVKAFFHGRVWKKILAFSFFLLIAFGFWVLQYLQQRFEISVVVPIHYKNIPEQIALNPGLPQEISLRIADKGTILLNYSLSQKITSIDIDLNKINPAKSLYSISGIALEKEIARCLLASTSLVSYTPDRIDVKYDSQMEKTVPVRIAGSILPKSGYMFEDSIYVVPQEITVYGSEVILDTLEVIFTKSLDLKDLQSHFEKKVDLVFPDGVSSDKKTVVLSGDIEGYTEKTFKLPVACKNVPDGYVVRLFPSVVEFTCQVALSRYTSLSEEDFGLYVNYSDLIDNKASSAPVGVSVTPQWVKHYRLSPENVEFLIEKRSEK